MTLPGNTFSSFSPQTKQEAVKESLHKGETDFSFPGQTGLWICSALQLSKKRNGNQRWKDRGRRVSSGIACIPSVWLNKVICVSCGQRDPRRIARLYPSCWQPIQKAACWTEVRRVKGNDLEQDCAHQGTTQWRVLMRLNKELRQAPYERTGILISAKEQAGMACHPRPGVVCNSHLVQ